MSKRIEWNGTADIEVAADQWEEQQAVLKALAEREAEEAAMVDALSDITTECVADGVDSCLALAMIDGIVPIPEVYLTSNEEAPRVMEAQPVGANL